MFKFSFALSSLILIVLSIAIFSQTPRPTAAPRTDDADVVKISTALIQIDVTVTDKKGNPAAGLQPEDFEILENGDAQTITNFSYVPLTDLTLEEEEVAESKIKDSLPPLPPGSLKPEEIRRTYALVVDDLGLSFENSFFVKEALKKFINEQMQPGDLVAILRVSRGIGALQSFTSDKRLLLAAAEKIRWNSISRTGLNSFEPVVSSMKEQLTGTKRSDGTVKTIEGIAKENEANLGAREAFRENSAYGTLGALRYIIRGMNDLPGRKSLMLFSEGFSTFDYSETLSGRSNLPRTNEIYDGLRGLAELANRSAVVIYTLDPRGLTVPGDLPLAADDLNDSSVAAKLKIRGRRIIDSQNSLRFLAEETGGIAYVEQNGLNRGIGKVLNDQRGYYLIGYQPEAETFDPQKNKFNKLTVKLKRPDLRIRYRSGFFGVTDEKYQQTNRTPQQQLVAALVSPFGAAQVNLDLYSIFYNDDRDRNFIRSFVYIDPQDLAFARGADGLHRAKFEIIAMIFDSNGAAAGNNINAVDLEFTDERFAVVQKKGILYNLTVPIVKTGAYQFRIALRDAATGKIGAASQFIELPNLDKKRLTLSSVILKGFSMNEWKKISLGQSPDEKSSDKSALLDTVSRQFRRGTVFTYAFAIYNAKTDSQRKPQLRIQTRLFRDGKVILEGAPSPVETSRQPDARRIEVLDAVTLGTDLAPGEYVLQLIVSDQLAKGDKRLAAQTVDFEIVE